jgi:alpha-1,3-rhamnosyl/mannosyltransferase
MDIDGPFVLYVGNVKAHKNLTGLITAFEQLPNSSLRLVIAGTVGGFRVGDDAVNIALARSPAADRIRATGWVDDDQLLALYQGAHLLAMPSLYEGFGLPVVEAMACGTPVVCSDRASLPEVAGDGAVLVDPEDAGAFSAAIERVAGDDELREDLINRGLERARLFSWQASARAHVELYEEVAGKA